MAANHPVARNIRDIVEEPPNGVRYAPSGVLVGGTRQRRFAGTNLKPRKLPENAQSPTRRVHAVLGGRLIAPA